MTCSNHRDIKCVSMTIFGLDSYEVAELIQKCPMSCKKCVKPTPNPTVAPTSANCHDIKGFRDKFGSPCETFSGLQCHLIGWLGYSDEEIGEIMHACTESCGLCREPSFYSDSSALPTFTPTYSPTGELTNELLTLSMEPSNIPNIFPSGFPVNLQTGVPSRLYHSGIPSISPSITSSQFPSFSPSYIASGNPSISRSVSPSSSLTESLTYHPSHVIIYFFQASGLDSNASSLVSLDVPSSTPTYVSKFSATPTWHEVNGSDLFRSKTIDITSVPTSFNSTDITAVPTSLNSTDITASSTTSPSFNQIENLTQSELARASLHDRNESVSVITDIDRIVDPSNITNTEDSATALEILLNAKSLTVIIVSAVLLALIILLSYSGNRKKSNLKMNQKRNQIREERMQSELEVALSSRMSSTDSSVDDELTVETRNTNGGILKSPKSSILLTTTKDRIGTCSTLNTENMMEKYGESDILGTYESSMDIEGKNPKEIKSILKKRASQSFDILTTTAYSSDSDFELIDGERILSVISSSKSSNESFGFYDSYQIS
mmetsp:Transcript_37388/g.87195  ORF Transcript_37388/g.87195 Transcript_37388/m.87195 type:complete len:549 (-) Transcript_37388:160-1806(-)